MHIAPGSAKRLKFMPTICKVRNNPSIQSIYFILNRIREILMMKSGTIDYGFCIPASFKLENAQQRHGNNPAAARAPQHGNTLAIFHESGTHAGQHSFSRLDCISFCTNQSIRIGRSRFR